MAKTQQKKRNKKYNPNKARPPRDLTIDIATRNDHSLVPLEYVDEVFKYLSDAIATVRANRMDFDTYYELLYYARVVMSLIESTQKQVVFKPATQDEAAIRNAENRELLYRVTLSINRDILRDNLLGQIADLYSGYERNKQWVIDYPLLAAIEKVVDESKQLIEQFTTVSSFYMAGRMSERFMHSYLDLMEKRRPEGYEHLIEHGFLFHRLRKPYHEFGDQYLDMKTKYGEGRILVSMRGTQNLVVSVVGRMAGYRVDVMNIVNDKSLDVRTVLLSVLSVLVAMNKHQLSLRYTTLNNQNPTAVSDFAQANGITHDEMQACIDEATCYYRGQYDVDPSELKTIH